MEKNVRKMILKCLHDHDLTLKTIISGFFVFIYMIEIMHSFQTIVIHIFKEKNKTDFFCMEIYLYFAFF